MSDTTHSVRLHRVLRAPPERVYRAFLDPDAMAMRDEDPARSKRVSDAMLEMVKLDIAALERARRSRGGLPTCLPCPSGRRWRRI